jgi:N4-gp56 family major capsid protein
VWISRKITDFHEDPVLEDAGKNLGEIMAENTEVVRFNTLKAGTVAYYPGTATSRGTVDGPLTVTMLRKAERALKRARARTIGELVAPSVKYGTESVNPAYWVVGHTDCKADIEQLQGFTPAKDYSNLVAIEGEIGAWGSFRFVLTDLFEPWQAAGASGTTYLSGREKVAAPAACDVYPLLVFGKDAYGIVPFAGKDGVEIKVMKPGSVDSGQPLGQQGFVSGFRYEGCAILQDAYMLRFEVAATAL